MPIVTRAGDADLATATFEKLPVIWSHFVIGDANGVPYVPDFEQKALVNEVYRGEINSYTMIDEITGMFELVLPANVGGFIIREVGLLNQDGDLVAVDCLPEGQEEAKVKYSTDSARRFNDFIIRFVVHIDNAENVKVQVDPYTAIASRGYVDEQLEKLKSEIEGFGFTPITNEEIDEITGMPIGDIGDVEIYETHGWITNDEIDEITGEPLEGILNGESLSPDEVDRLLDDDPSNDPEYDTASQAIPASEIQNILGE